MAIEIKVPSLGESVTSASVARWMKKAGEPVAADEPLVELETDKVTVEVNAPSAGRLSEIVVPEGTEVAVGALLGRIEAAAAGAPHPHVPAPTPAGVNPPPQPLGPVSRPASPPAGDGTTHPPLPAAAKLMAENAIAPGAIGAGAGKDGRITKGDVLEFLKRRSPNGPPRPLRPHPPRRRPPRRRPARPMRARNGCA